eukprot:5290760-Pleurochrysis_carterae.AAC.5
MRNIDAQSYLPSTVLSAALTPAQGHCLPAAIGGHQQQQQVMVAAANCAGQPYVLGVNTSRRSSSNDQPTLREAPTLLRLTEASRVYP